MTLPWLQLAEPVVAALVNLLQTNLPGVIDQLNATVTDGYKVDHPAQYLDYVPVLSTLEGGMPAIGVQRFGGHFVDDLQTTMDATHRYAVVAIIQNADQRSLAKQLERTLECVGYTIAQDRVAGNASVLRSQAGVWSVNFEDYEPGPLLGDLDPTNPDAPPRSYLSYSAMTFSSTRGEIV